MKMFELERKVNTWKEKNAQVNYYASMGLNKYKDDKFLRSKDIHMKLETRSKKASFIYLALQFSMVG
jgi:hypothetical protein